MTAGELLEIVRIGIVGHPEIVAVRPVRSVYRDRLALGVEDDQRQLWRVFVLLEPLR